ncbi:mitogen-activated protein-binding protein-interacting protein [Phycomyces nitens]|nr:mitogen-activated protein-binding protein-interacting protein [Phycomyces nitens]
MLKPKVIAQVLRQATRDGVKASLLMTSEGSLLAFAADNDRSAKIYAAIAANVWSTYKQHCSSDTFLKGDQTGGLRFILMQCEEGNVFVTCISSMLLCLVGENSVDLGILKVKASWLCVCFSV